MVSGVGCSLQKWGIRALIHCKSTPCFQSDPPSFLHTGFFIIITFRACSQDRNICCSVGLPPSNTWALMLFCLRSEALQCWGGFSIEFLGLIWQGSVMRGVCDALPEIRTSAALCVLINWGNCPDLASQTIAEEFSTLQSHSGSQVSGSSD